MLALRALHGLSRRWIVFVPAGLVIHDPLTMSDAVLFPRRSIVSLGPADPADAARPRPRRDRWRPVSRCTWRWMSPSRSASATAAGTTSLEVADILVTPTRPGEVLAEARRRRIRVSALRSSAAHAAASDHSSRS